MRVEVDVRGLDEAIRNDPQRVELWLDRVAENMITEIKLSFGTSPDGKMYKRKRKPHIASRAGYPPNVDTGALRASMRWERTGDMERTLSDGVEYGLKLEVGTSEIRPRPFMRPVFDRTRRTIEQDAVSYLGLNRE